MKKDHLREVFDKVSAHLLAQGRRSAAREGGACLYRGPDGLRCAVGCLIDDEHYDPSLEGQATGATPGCEETTRALIESGVTCDREMLEMLEVLQDLHDENDPAEWATDLALLKKRWAL